MKPILLKMRAFESYLDETEIDFSKLDSSGIFLIWGNTGSGKTTIFDAITYALYGELSQQQKEDAHSLRTLDAPNDVKTEVSFLFEEKNRRYLITRSPKQKNSNGKEVPANATLHFLSEEKDDLDGVKAVTQKVEEIIGLSSGQFFQTTLIAQGSFAKILVAKTEERIKIFRTLFDTYFYQNFVDVLKEKKASVQTEARMLNDRLESIYSLPEFYDENDKEKGKEINETKARLSFLNECISKYKNLENEAKEEKRHLDQELHLLIAEREKANAYVHDQKQLVDIKNLYAKNLFLLQQKEKELEDLEKQKEKIDQIHDEATLLESKLSQYLALSSVNEKISNVQKKLKTNENKLDKIYKEIVENEKSMHSLNRQIEKLQKETENTTDYTIKIVKLTEEINKLDSYKKKANDLLSFANKLIDLNRVYKKAEEESQKAHEYFVQVDLKYYESMSGIIAQEKLEEGKPCPVCGSIHHPHIQKLTVDNVSKEDYEKAKKADDEKRENRYHAVTEFENTLDKYNMLQQEILPYATSVGYQVLDEVDRKHSASILYQFLSEQEKNKKQEKEALEREERQLQAMQKELKEKSLLLKQKQSEKETVQKESGELEKEIVAQKQELESLYENRNNIASTLEYESKEAALKKIDFLRDEEREYHARKKKTQEDYDTALKKEQECQGQQKELQTRIDSYRGHPLEEIESNWQTKRKEAETIEHVLKELSSSIKSINNVYVLYQKESEKFEEITKFFDVYNTLVFAFSGNNDRLVQEKYDVEKGVSLETYVLEYYLDQVLLRASKRLFKISDSRYRLIRREASGKVGQVGLDIDVLDCITGKQRNAGSLSGGETFIASLSLALGLSDYVREIAGGVHIETLFIDEGFGNLDKDILDGVLETISTIAMEGQATIGLISHVEELAARFSSKILVQKDHMGHSQCHLDIN